MLITEVPPELPDGVRTRFTSSVQFAPGSTAARVRGMLRRRTDENFGWTEIQPNIFEFNSPPLTGDRVILMFGVA